MKNIKNILKNTKGRNLLIVLILSSIIVSCSTPKNYYRADFVKLNNKIDGEFYNTQMKNKKDSSSYHRITALFGIKSNDSLVKLKTVDNNLVISYRDESGKLMHNSYPGDFKNKHFEVYLRYETITIPLLIVTKQMKYLRISMLENNNLVIDYDYTNEGMILIMGAGNSYSSELIYKSKNK